MYANEPTNPGVSSITAPDAWFEVNDFVQNNYSSSLLQPIILKMHGTLNHDIKASVLNR